MFKKYIRHDFMKAVSKATLVVLLALPLASSHAQDPSASFTPEVAATETSAQAFDIVLKEGNTDTVLLKTTEDRAGLIKQYPVLKETAEQMDILFEQTGSRSPTEFMVSKVRDPQTNTNLLFVYLQGDDACGSAGCNLSIYADTGKGYESKFSAIVSNPMYVAKQDGQVSLYFCSSTQGRAQWNFTEGEFKLAEVVKAPTTGPKCPGFQ